MRQQERGTPKTRFHGRINSTVMDVLCRIALERDVSIPIVIEDLVEFYLLVHSQYQKTSVHNVETTRPK